MLTHGTVSGQRGMDAYEHQYRERAVQSVTRRAKAFDYTLVHTPGGTLTEPSRRKQFLGRPSDDVRISFYYMFCDPLALMMESYTRAKTIFKASSILVMTVSSNAPRTLTSRAR
jgi:hypothetical protein